MSMNSNSSKIKDVHSVTGKKKDQEGQRIFLTYDLVQFVENLPMKISFFYQKIYKMNKEIRFHKNFY